MLFCFPQQGPDKFFDDQPPCWLTCWLLDGNNLKRVCHDSKFNNSAAAGYQVRELAAGSFWLCQDRRFWSCSCCGLSQCPFAGLLLVDACIFHLVTRLSSRERSCMTTVVHHRAILRHSVWVGARITSIASRIAFGKDTPTLEPLAHSADFCCGRQNESSQGRIGIVHLYIHVNVPGPERLRGDWRLCPPAPPRGDARPSL